MGIVSTNVTSTALINSDCKKVENKLDCCILHTVSLFFFIIILFMIDIICYHYAKHRSQQKTTDALTIKNRTSYHLDGIIKSEYFAFDNVLIDKKSHENILIYGISYITLTGPKALCIGFDKRDEFIRIYGGTRYWLLFHPEKYDAIYNRIRYLVNVKSGITCIFFSILWKKKSKKIDVYDF